MNEQHATDIIRDLKTELHNAKTTAKSLGALDVAQLYYNGVIVGLQLAIGKYEQIYNGTVPKSAKKRRGR